MHCPIELYGLSWLLMNDYQSSILFSGPYLILTLMALRKSHGNILAWTYRTTSTLVWMRRAGKIIANSWWILYFKLYYLLDIWICKRIISIVQEQYRLETTMQSKIRVYESGRAEQVIVCFGIMHAMVYGYSYSKINRIFQFLLGEEESFWFSIEFTLGIRSWFATRTSSGNRFPCYSWQFKCWKVRHWTEWFG